jgi:predicted hotdog family 3-hydroxylacyl-ACP dehydratase
VIDREWIARHIPHQGSMCLLDAVESWDEQNAVCLSNGHLHSANPLRAQDSLGIANAIEYAAQAMAVHCALMIGSALPGSGYLASVREVHWYRSRFDDVANNLRVQVRRISGNEINVLYSFEIWCDSQLLMNGRAGIVLNVGVKTRSAKSEH